MFHSVKQFYRIWQPKFSPRNKSMLAQCIKSKRQKKKKKKIRDDGDDRKFY